jgi:hypothetical protein
MLPLSFFIYFIAPRPILPFFVTSLEVPLPLSLKLVPVAKLAAETREKAACTGCYTDR